MYMYMYVHVCMLLEWRVYMYIVYKYDESLTSAGSPGQPAGAVSSCSEAVCNGETRGKGGVRVSPLLARVLILHFDQYCMCTLYRVCPACALS